MSLTGNSHHRTSAYPALKRDQRTSSPRSSALAPLSRHFDHSGLPDALSTSSSTLVNLDSDIEIRPWEVASSQDFDRDASSLPSEGGTEATETPSPRALRTSSQRSSPVNPSVRRPAHIDLGAEGSSSSPRRIRTKTQRLQQITACPDDCRCSDQEIERGLCRCALNSSSSEAEVELKKAQARSRARFSPRKAQIREEAPHTMFESFFERSQSYSIASLGGSRGHRTSPKRQSLSGWSGRDISENPVLVPREVKPSPRPATRRLSFSHLDAQASEDEEEEKRQASRSSSRLLGQWARRAAETQTPSDEEPPMTAPAAKVSHSPMQPHSATKGSGSASFSVGQATPARHLTSIRTPTTPQSAPPTAAKYAADRRSIAAVFEKMQAEREQREREEEQAREEKRLQRKRERAARALGWQRRRPSQGVEVLPENEVAPVERVHAPTSAARVDTPVPPDFQSPPSTSTPSNKPSAMREASPDEKVSEDEADTTARARALARVRHARLKRLSASPHSGDSTPTDAQDETVIRPRFPTLSAQRGTPSPKEERRKHLLEESTSETVSDDEDDHVQQEAGSADIEEEERRFDRTAENAGADPSSASQAAYNQQPGTRELAPGQSSPATPQLSSGFSFPSQSSPTASSSSVRSSSAFSSPASSPRKNAHRRQRTSVVSITKNLPASSEMAAARAINRVLGPSTPNQPTMGLNIQGQHSVTPSIDETPGVTRKDHILYFNRRNRSVRFSPKPDYRSDSGSGEWGEADDHGSPDEMEIGQTLGLRVVNRTPTDSNVSSANTSLEDVDDHAPANGSTHTGPSRTQISLAPIERALQLEGEAKTRMQQESRPTPSTPNSFSMHLPGAYAQSPSVSRAAKKQAGANNGTRPRALSPPLPVAISPPSISMSLSQRQKLAASRGLHISPSNSASALIEEEEEDLEPIHSKDFDDSSLSAGQLQNNRILSSEAPRESTPPRTSADNTLRLRSDNSSDPLTSPSPLRNELVFGNPADESMRDTVERILAALQRREQAEQPSSDDIQAAIDHVGGQMREAVRKTAAELPKRQEAPASQAVEQALALTATPAEELDASFIEKVDGLRERLTNLVAGLGTKLRQKSNQQPVAGYKTSTILLAVAAQVILMWFMLNAAQERQDYYYQTTYYNPFYPEIYGYERSLLYPASFNSESTGLFFLLDCIATIISAPFELISFMIWGGEPRLDQLLLRPRVPF